jgi:broad specificity phosphatase PhoE
MNKHLTLIRHAAIAAALDGHYIGRTDVPLSTAGMRQAEELMLQVAQHTAPSIDRLWCSPARRARQTAHPLSEHLGCAVSINPHLHEIDFGVWEGLTFTQILEKDPRKVDEWAEFAPEFSFPGGESLAQFNERIESVAAAIHAENCNHLAIISHGGVLRGLICALLHWPLRDHLKFTLRRGGYATLETHGSHAVLTGLYNHGS